MNAQSPAEKGHGQCDQEERIALRIDRAAALLGVSKKTVERLISRGDLPHVKIGRCTVVIREDLNQWAYAQRRCRCHSAA